MLATLTSISLIGFRSHNNTFLKPYKFCAPISNKTCYGALDSPFNYITTISILKVTNIIF